MRMVAALLAAAMLAAAAGAQDDPTDLYLRANAAAEEGRGADAVSLGEQAWRAAEAQWGDRQETGILAINLARFLFDQAREAEALEPAARILALAEAGYLDGVATPTEASLFLGVAEVASGEEGGAARLEEALATQGRTATEFEDVAAIAWIRLLEDHQANERWRRLAELAGQARIQLAALGDAYATYVLRAAALEAQASVRREDFFQANVAFGWAAYAYAVAYPDAAKAATNPDYAMLLVSKAATSAWIETNDEVEPRLGTRIPPDSGIPRMIEPGSVQEAAPDLPDRGAPMCYAWPADRRPPVFPTAELRRGRYGAVMIGYDVARDGTVGNIRTVATAPDELSPAFAAAVEAAMQDWRAEVPADAPDDCLRDQVTTVQFAFD